MEEEASAILRRNIVKADRLLKKSSKRSASTIRTKPIDDGYSSARQKLACLIKFGLYFNILLTLRLHVGNLGLAIYCFQMFHVPLISYCFRELHFVYFILFS